jgi:hypothetical protein
MVIRGIIFAFTASTYYISIAFKTSFFVFGGCYKDGKMSEGVFIFDLGKLSISLLSQLVNY